MLPKFSSRAFLAPMAGVSDPALRLQCKKMGAGLVVTEFTNIHSIIAKESQLKERMKTIQEIDTEIICKELDISSSNLWVIIHRARMQLRKCLEENWFNN